MQDIFTLQEIVTAKEEHVIPSALNGRLTSRNLIDASTNGLFGASLEKHLLEALLPLRLGLGFSSRRGQPLVMESGDPHVLTSSGMRPEVSRRFEGIFEVDGKIQIRAGTRAKSLQLLEAARRKYGDITVGEVVVNHRHVDAEFQVALGGPIHLRALGKICFEFLALHCPRDFVCSAAFDTFRSWVIDGARRCSEMAVPGYNERVSLVNWDLREEIWSGLPRLDDAPFQHRLFFVVDDVKGAWAGLELFGALRFTCCLSSQSGLATSAKLYLLDPLNASTACTRDLAASGAVPVPTTETPPATYDLGAAKNAMEKLMGNLMEHVWSSTVNELIEAAMKRCFPAEGEIIEPHHVEAVSAELAERFSRMVLRVDDTRTMSLAEYLGTGEP